MPIRMARIYDNPSGHRVLVDRLWPRGVQKEAAPWDDWTKDLAPSNALRKAYHAGKLDFVAFATAYRDELAGKARPAVRPNTVLVTAAKDLPMSHVPVLRAWLDAPSGGQTPRGAQTPAQGRAP